MKFLQTIAAIILIFCSNPLQSQSEDLTIGWIGALSGDAAAIGTEILAALETAAFEINDRGGIEGRKLRILPEDDGYEITRALSAYERLKTEVNSKIIFASTYGAMFALGKRPEDGERSGARRRLPGRDYKN